MSRTMTKGEHTESAREQYRREMRRRRQERAAQLAAACEGDDLWHLIECDQPAGRRLAQGQGQ